MAHISVFFAGCFFVFLIQEIRDKSYSEAAVSFALMGAYLAMSRWF